MVKKYCPHCKNQLEQIQACGCQDLFCQHCGMLVSKKQAICVDSEQFECAFAEAAKTSDQPSTSTRYTHPDDFY